MIVLSSTTHSLSFLDCVLKLHRGARLLVSRPPTSLLALVIDNPVFVLVVAVTCHVDLP